jgi:hypothetical protein
LHALLEQQVQAGLIFTEEEVEYRARSVLANVESSLSSGAFSWGNPPKIEYWTAPLYDYKVGLLSQVLSTFYLPFITY